MRKEKNIMERKVRLKTVNPYITCMLCRGYLINATTITECLHTFCRSCLVKFLEKNNTCPKCDIVIHQSHPLNYVSFDRTMQDIVFKLVPNLQQNESNKESKFYKSRGMQAPKDATGPAEENGNTSPTPSTTEEDNDYHRSDEQVNICLECNSLQLKKLKRKYLRCSSQATITHLKKFLALKLYNNDGKYKDVDVLCNDELLGKDHTLKFVCMTRWRFKHTPLLLHYRPRVEL